MIESQEKFDMNPLNKQKEEGQVQATETPIPTGLFLLSSSWKQREVKGRRELELSWPPAPSTPTQRENGGPRSSFQKVLARQNKNIFDLKWYIRSKSRLCSMSRHIFAHLMFFVCNTICYFLAHCLPRPKKLLAIFGDFDIRHWRFEKKSSGHTAS